MSFFDSKYDEKTYIQEQILEIQDVHIRKEAQEIISRVLQPFYEELETAYGSLEARMADVRGQAEEFQIITAIQPRKKVDVTDGFWHPMRQQDMEKRTISAEELSESLEQGKAYELYQIFVEDTYDKILELVHTRQSLPAEILTEYGHYNGKAVLEPSDGYEEILLQLYEDFVQNGIEWKTVNAPYLHKLLKVMLIEADCPVDEGIENIKVDFGAYKDIIHYDYVPLWNIAMVRVKTSVYPRQSRDSIYFDHVIHNTKLRSDCSYLVHKADTVWDTRRDMETGDFIITCQKRKPTEWTLWEFTSPDHAGCSKVEGMGNGNTVRRPHIRTQAEAIRFAAGLAISEYVTLLQVTTEAPENRKEIRTYCMDLFLPEEIRKKADAPRLYLECSVKNPGHYLNQDMFSFLASRFELIYPEYQCVVCVKN